MTALVGVSGSGKSSVVNLIQRFYDTQQGSILFDGADMRSLDPSWLRRQFGIVSQEPRLFRATIAENIGWGLDPPPTEAEVRSAARSACLDDFVQGLPQGYDTVVADSKLLSGGQRQRLAIARALVRDPPVLILDEAYSALDTTSARLVAQALEKARWSPRLGRPRTVIVIAHRLFSVQRSNHIVVMDAGRVVESGTHSELLALGGAYSRLVLDSAQQAG